MFRSPLWLAFALGLFGGCFKDSPAGSDESGGCEEGSQGCACYGNGTCDGGLECSMNVCVPENCTPGQELCTCVDGECLGDLVCEQGTCREAAAETGTESGEGTSDSTETGMDTIGTDATMSDSVSETAEASTTLPGGCDDLGDCPACQDCANFESCSQQFGDCVNNIDCSNFGDCVAQCGDDSVCVDGCENQYPEGALIYFAYAQCICEACFLSCGAQECGG